jgi:serine/threonine protein kinase
MAATQGQQPALAPAASDLTGSSIGRFTIRALLGTGGMGQVYRAEDSKLMRKVALKRMAPQFRGDEHYRRRFLKEAQLACRLTNEHIAAVYDVLEELSEIFLVMEYVEGQTLRQRMTRPLAVDQVLEIAAQCATALAAAHAQGIVHRDIKPENIMLTLSFQVKILDLGVAKILPTADGSTARDTPASSTGGVCGTPAYMAPEILLEREANGRADIFSLGVVLYETLTGRHPLLADTFLETAERILHHVPLPANVVDARVPEELARILAKMLVKDPNERYATSADLLVDLRALQRARAYPSLSTPAPGAPGPILRTPMPTPALRTPSPAPGPQTLQPNSGFSSDVMTPAPAETTAPITLHHLNHPRELGMRKRAFALLFTGMAILGLYVVAPQIPEHAFERARDFVLQERATKSSSAPGTPEGKKVEIQTQASAAAVENSIVVKREGQAPTTTQLPSVERPTTIAAPLPARPLQTVAVRPGKILVRTDPVGAQAVLKDLQQEKTVLECTTPCDSGDLAPGKYLLTASQADYHPVLRLITLETGSLFEAPIQLQPILGTLYIESTPDQAEVFLNGVRQQGSTPATLDLRPGKYQMLLQKAGYAPFSDNLEVKADSLLRVRATLFPQK